ncbi:MAG: hypothetical protein WCB92_00860 [Mycobacterium sp.]
MADNAFPWHSPRFPSSSATRAAGLSTYDQVDKNSFRIANRLDIVPALPPPDDYEHVLNPYELNPIRFLPLPPKVLVKFTPECEHSLATYLYLLSLQSGGTVIPLESTCQP